MKKIKSNSCYKLGIMGDDERQPLDLYCTPPIAVNLLLNQESFNPNIWEPCNGLNHISNQLIQHGYKVRKSDIVKYSDDIEELDFLLSNEAWHGDIITNPPYRNAEEFVIKALECVNNGAKIAFYMKINFLSSRKRYALFAAYPPKTIYIMSNRFNCAKNGEFHRYGNGAVDYIWVIWEKGFEGYTTTKWLFEHKLLTPKTTKTMARKKTNELTKLQDALIKIDFTSIEEQDIKAAFDAAINASKIAAKRRQIAQLEQEIAELEK